MSEVLFLYCSHISFWPTFFKLPLGFCTGRGSITFIYEIEVKESEVGDLFMFIFIFLVLSLLSVCRPFSYCISIPPFPRLFLTLLSLLQHVLLCKMALIATMGSQVMRGKYAWKLRGKGIETGGKE